MAALLISLLLATLAPTRPPEHLTVGLFIGSIEEGARIFTPVRLLPFDHPEALGHEFPNALVLHESEYEVLTALGHRIGLALEATLQRYPRLPITEWRYQGFEPLPANDIAKGAVLASSSPSPPPGLRAAVFARGMPVAFIVDTRDMTLEARGMDRPTTMGLDLTRAEFLEALERAGRAYADQDWVTVTFAVAPGG